MYVQLWWHPGSSVEGKLLSSSFMAISYLKISAICTVMSLWGLQWSFRSLLAELESDGLIGESLLESDNSTRVLELLSSHSATAFLANFALNLFVLAVLCLKVNTLMGCSLISWGSKCVLENIDVVRYLEAYKMELLIILKVVSLKIINLSLISDPRIVKIQENFFSVTRGLALIQFHCKLIHMALLETWSWSTHVTGAWNDMGFTGEPIGASSFWSNSNLMSSRGLWVHYAAKIFC